MQNKITEIRKILESIIIESKYLSNEEKDLLKQFRDSSPGNVHATTTQKYKKARERIDNYKKNIQHADETGKNILKGQIKREKTQNLNRYDEQASNLNPELRKKQKDIIWKFIKKKQANIGK